MSSLYSNIAGLLPKLGVDAVTDAEDYEAVQGILTELAGDQESAKESVLADTFYSLSEILAKMDEDQNGFASADLEQGWFSRNAAAFQTIADVFRKHGCPISVCLGDFDAAVERFVTTGNYPAVLEHDETFFFQALERDPASFRWMPQTAIRRFPKLIDLAVTLRPENAEFMPDVAPTAGNFWELAEACPVYLSRLTPAEQLESAERIYHILVNRPAAVRHTCAEFQLENPRMMRHVVSIWGGPISRENIAVFMLSPEYLQSHPDIFLEAIRSQGKIATLVREDDLRGLDFSRVGKTVSCLEDFYVEAVLVNFHVGEYVPEASRSTIWARVKERCLREGLLFPEPALESYGQFRDYLLGHTMRPNRFRSMAVIYEIFEGSSLLGPDESDPRPVQYFGTSIGDHNGNFETVPFLDWLADGPYRIEYAESKTTEVMTAPPPDLEASLAWFQGHGAIDSIELSPTSRVSSSDFEEPHPETDFLAAGAKLFIRACSVGMGEGGADNFHNSAAGSYPEAAVASSPEPIYSDHEFFYYEEDGTPVWMTYAYDKQRFAYVLIDLYETAPWAIQPGIANESPREKRDESVYDAAKARNQSAKT